MKLFIKYMVSLRCKMIVKEELANLGLRPSKVELGVVEVKDHVSDELREKIRVNLSRCGLELLEDRTSILIEQIKGVVIEMVHYSEEPLVVNFSVYLSEKLNHDYTYMANLFSEVQGTTIEQYIINHKIEYIKELMVYGELNLTEIAYKMNYSSVAHLSNQFKKVKGVTPSEFRREGK